MLATLLSLASVLSAPSPNPSQACELVRTDVRHVAPVYGAAAASDGASVYFAGGDGPHALRGDVWRYTPGARGVTELKVGITPRRYPGAAFFQGRLVVVGGSDRARALALVEAIDVERATLEVWPALRTARAFPGVAVHEGRLWVAGGELGGRATDSVEIYDAAAKAWRAGPPLSVARATRLVVMDGALWALPGYDGREAVAVLERLEGDRWVRVDGAHALSAFAASPIEGGALLFGDYRAQGDVWFLSRTGAMSRAATPQIERRHAASATAAGQVVVLGGNRTSANKSSVGVLEAFEARCAAPSAQGTCRELLERGVRALRDGDEVGGRALLEEAAAHCGVGRFAWLNIARSHLQRGRALDGARALARELERPAAHPDALDTALRVSRDPNPDVDGVFFALGRTKERAISVGKVKGQRAWVQRFACPGRAEPKELKQALTRDNLDRWTFTCADGAGELWFDFETRPVAAFAAGVEPANP